MILILGFNQIVALVLLHISSTKTLVNRSIRAKFRVYGPLTIVMLRSHVAHPTLCLPNRTQGFDHFLLGLEHIPYSNNTTFDVRLG